MVPYTKDYYSLPIRRYFYFGYLGFPHCDMHKNVVGLGSAIFKISYFLCVGYGDNTM